MADAAAAKVAILSNQQDENVVSKLADSLSAAKSDQSRRFRAAQRIVCKTIVPPASGAAPVAVAGTSAKNAKDTAATNPVADSITPLLSLGAVSSGAGFPAYVPCLSWWDDPISSTVEHSARGDSSIMGEDDVDENEFTENFSNSPQLGPSGSVPGMKPLPSDPAALGLIVPGCPLGATRWKARLISALARAMKRGVALGATWLVESAAKRLWNFHLHVWSANEYSLAVLPLLLGAAADALACLAAVSSSASELCTKIGAAVARSHEESA